MAAAVACALGAARVARAQAYVTEDAEGGSFLKTDVPSGQWSSVEQPGTSTVGFSTAAPHRGQRMLEVTDVTSQPGAGNGPALYATLSGAPTGSYFLRTWLRVASTNHQGSIVVTQVVGNVANNAFCDLLLSFPGAVLSAQGVNAGNTWSIDATNASLGVGSWHLLECGLSGVGTAAGARTVWLDGVQVAQRTGIDWAGTFLTEVAAGIPWSDVRTFTGTVQLDDLRTSATPPASRVVVSSAAGDLRVGDCHPLQASLQSSSGGTASAPYDLPVDLTWSLAGTGTPTGQLFADAACTVPTSTVTVPAGSSEVSFGISSGTPEAGSLTAQQVDLLSGAALALSFSDTGAPGASRAGSGGAGAGAGSGTGGALADELLFSVGCGCRSSAGGGVEAGGGAALSWLVLLAAWRLVRRRRPG